MPLEIANFQVQSHLAKFLDIHAVLPFAFDPVLETDVVVVTLGARFSCSVRLMATSAQRFLQRGKLTVRQRLRVLPGDSGGGGGGR